MTWKHYRLRNCQFCKSDRVQISSQKTYEERFFWVACMTCSARGPLSLSRNVAEERWGLIEEKKNEKTKD